MKVKLKYIVYTILFIVFIFLNYIVADFLAIKFDIKKKIFPALTVLSWDMNGTVYIFRILLLVELIIIICFYKKIFKK